MSGKFKHIIMYTKSCSLSSLYSIQYKVHITHITIYENYHDDYDAADDDEASLVPAVLLLSLKVGLGLEFTVGSWLDLSFLDQVQFV